MVPKVGVLLAGALSYGALLMTSCRAPGADAAVDAAAEERPADAARPDTRPRDLAPERSEPPDSGLALDGGRPGWRLVWGDEFDGLAGSAPDPTKWKHETGGGGWGNDELQFYTAARENSALDGQGHLAITARKEPYMTRGHTSARLNTAGRFSQKYGRFEIRAKLPVGRGIWPAFWALGGDIGTIGWPACGEIDVMEYKGSEPSTNHGSLHGPGYSGGNPLTRSYRLPSGAFNEGFHVFAVEWEEGVVRFYVDDSLYQTRTPMDLRGEARWVFDHPFFLILNMAVGGRFLGPPDETTVFPQALLVDHVRVYAR